MSSLTLTARSLQKERNQIERAVFTKSLSQAFLSNLFLCTPEQLEKIAQAQGLTPIKQKGYNNLLRTHYRINDLPTLIQGLQNTLSPQPQNEAAEKWRTTLMSIDTTQESFTLVRPDGSSLTFSRK